MHFNSCLLHHLDNTTFLEMREQTSIFTVDTFLQMYQKWLKQLVTTILVTGNLSTAQALDIQQILEEVFKESETLPRERVGEQRVT